MRPRPLHSPLNFRCTTARDFVATKYRSASAALDTNSAPSKIYLMNKANSLDTSQTVRANISDSTHMSPHRLQGDTAGRAKLRDGWTHDPEYRQCYQTESDIETILGLLALERGSTLADVGCGNGAFAIAAAQRHPDCEVWAFDALDSAVAVCRERGAQFPNFRAVAAWAASLPLPTAGVDCVLFRSVLHHIAEPQVVYCELARLLKPGGRLVLQSPCNGWEASFGQVFSDLMMLGDDSHRRFYHLPQDIVTGLRQAGFSTEAPECWPFPFPFIDDSQAQFIRERGAEERLRLQPIEPGKWSIEGYWVRLVARRIA